MNKKIVLKNILISFFCQVITIILGFIVPRIILGQYGSDTNGLITTIAQVFTYLALFEAGISQATKNSLYLPINEGDKEKISEIVSISKKSYRRVSIFYCIGVVVLSIILPFIIKTNLDYLSVFLMILLEGFGNAVCFYFIQTKNAFLSTDGKNYVVNIIDTIIRVLTYIIKIVLALFKLNILLVQLTFFIFSFVKLFIYYLYTNKRYPWLNFNLKTSEKKLNGKNFFIVSEIAWTIFSSTDIIVLSIFISTSLASVYSVYSMVFISLSGLLGSVYFAINYVLGQEYHKDIQRYIKIHDIYNSFFIMSITILVSTAYVLIIPFINVYTNGVNDIEYVYKWLPLMFSLVQMLSWIRYIPGNLANISGYAKPTSIVSLIEALLNIIFSIILVFIFGIYGVLLATVLSLPIKVIYLYYLTEKRIFKRKPFRTILILSGNFLIFSLTILVNEVFNISNLIELSYLGLFIGGLIIFSIIFLLSFGLNVCINKDMLDIFRYFKRDNNI